MRSFTRRSKMQLDKLPAAVDPRRTDEINYSARESWRLLGIMAEFVESTERLASIRPAVSIFGSARTPADHAYYMLTEDIARKLSDAGFSVVSGGGPGIMEAANKGAYFGKSPSVGLNIQLPHEQSANAYQDISQTFQHFFARKVMFVKFAAAYVVMPGGYGTLDELTEALTLVQTGKIARIPIILVGSKFWAGLAGWVKDRLVGEGMISPEDVELMHIIDDPDQVVNAIFDHYEKRGFMPSLAERDIQLKIGRAHV